jgi:hypothetical protein
MFFFVLDSPFRKYANITNTPINTNLTGSVNVDRKSPGRVSWLIICLSADWSVKGDSRNLIGQCRRCLRHSVLPPEQCLNLYVWRTFLQWKQSELNTLSDSDNNLYYPLVYEVSITGKSVKLKYLWT